MCGPTDYRGKALIFWANESPIEVSGILGRAYLSLTIRARHVLDLWSLFPHNSASTPPFAQLRRGRQRGGYSVIRDSAALCQTQISGHMSERAAVPKNSRARRLSS